jgi:hypothetical protein
MECTLPTTENDMPERASLFALDPGRQPGVIRLISRQTEAALPNGLGMGVFELSPDEKRVVVMGKEGDKGRVAILTLASGQIEEVLKDAPDIDAQVPAWRSADEVSFLAPPKIPGGSPDREAIVIHALGGQTRCLSCGWSEPIKRSESASTAPASSRAE